MTDRTDAVLLSDALRLLEYVTFHDGRYGQERNEDFQAGAQQLVARIAQRLNVKPYAKQLGDSQ